MNWEKQGLRAPEDCRALLGLLDGKARQAELEQMGLGVSPETQDLRVTGASMAFQGCLVRRARGACKDLQGPLARLESRVPEV